MTFICNTQIPKENTLILMKWMKFGLWFKSNGEKQTRKIKTRITIICWMRYVICIPTSRTYIRTFLLLWIYSLCVSTLLGFFTLFLEILLKEPLALAKNFRKHWCSSSVFFHFCAERNCNKMIDNPLQCKIHQIITLITWIDCFDRFVRCKNTFH